MTIAVERIEVLGVNVRDLPEAEELFSRLFGLSFKSIVLNGPDIATERVPLKSGEEIADPNSVQDLPVPLAIDPTGFFELIETPDGQQANTMRNIHFKVTDIEAAIAEMQAHGIRVLGNLRCGGVREVIFHPDDLFGVRLCFVQYSGPSMIESMLS
jgi:catechol 2,3-dioxygenase-like lactoylglutathione lyase family enzyme